VNSATACAAEMALRSAVGFSGFGARAIFVTPGPGCHLVVRTETMIARETRSQGGFVRKRACRLRRYVTHRVVYE
jgi:hypothetical protein